MAPTCPANAFQFKATSCFCNPGYFLANASCALFNPRAGDWAVGSGVGPAPTILTTVLPLDAIRRISQPQAVLLVATLAALLAWLAFCAALRFGRLEGRHRLLFRIRWWISRLDFFGTEHWLDDQKVVTKRKTELGGTFSVASWILFVGLFSVLLYQFITRRSIEVRRIRPANAPDLQSFVSDMEFNITSISSMSCSHLRGLDTLVSGTPGFIDYRVFPLSSYTTPSCQNTSRGPTITLKCNSCSIPRRDHYITWQFIDLPNDPATAVGFQFNFTSKAHGNGRHVSFASGTLQSGNYTTDDKPRTFRGPEMNVLEIHLFPLAYNYLHDLKLIQPMLHDFMPGSSFSKASDLQASLGRSTDGLINTTLHIKYLSDYIVEIDHENVMGPVSFLADVGGLYAISLAIFLYILMQCETRIKKLRHEDAVMRSIRRQRRAQRNWNKLRKYVMYTWGPSNLDESKNQRRGSKILEIKKRSNDDSIFFPDETKMPHIEEGGDKDQSNATCKGNTS